MPLTEEVTDKIMDISIGQAVDYLNEAGEVSVFSLQERFGIDYKRARELLSALESDNLVRFAGGFIYKRAVYEDKNARSSASRVAPAFSSSSQNAPPPFDDEQIRILRERRLELGIKHRKLIELSIQGKTGTIEELRKGDKHIAALILCAREKVIDEDAFIERMGCNERTALGYLMWMKHNGYVEMKTKNYDFVYEAKLTEADILARVGRKKK